MDPHRHRGLLYVAVGDRLVRSSWVVLGAWGILQTAAHFAAKWSEDVLFGAFYFFPFLIAESLGSSGESRSNHAWASGLVFALTGVAFFVIALAIARRRGAAVPGADVL